MPAWCKIDYRMEVKYPFPMKTWITYIAAVLMGLATSLLFGSFAATASILSAVSSYLISLGVFIAIPVVFITFASGTASLMKDRKGHRVAGMAALWSLLSTVLLSFAAALVFVIMPESFPVTSSAGSAPGTLSALVSYSVSSAGSALYPLNALWSIASATRFIISVIIISWILGLALKPSADIIRPAYTTMNSFSEVMYRISRTFSVFGFFIVFLSSASFFTTMYQEKTVFAAPGFILMLTLSAAVAVFAVLPLLYGVFTGFRKNPYSILYRSLPQMLMGLSTANSVASIPLSESVARQSLGVQKRVASTATPLLSVIGKGGSAAISVIALLSLYIATTETMPPGNVIAVTAVAAALVSFISSAATGTECAAITVIVLQMLGINLYGAENAIIAFLPMLCGMGTAIDALITAYGNSIAASSIQTDVEIPYRDTL